MTLLSSASLVLSILGSVACVRQTPDPPQHVPVLVSGEPSVVLEAPAAVVQPPAREFDQGHTLWTSLLKKHVRGDEFDYGALARDPTELSAYLAEIEAVTPEQLSSWTKAQRFAFWINVYNANTIRKVIENYPLDSIRDLDRALGLKSVFDDEFIPMKPHHPEGKNDKLSLNDVEHEILRKDFADARLHAAVNCASIGCPPLRGEAFVAARLDEQLDEQMRAFVNDPRRNRFDSTEKELRISEIFKWFAEDFERDAGSVREYLLRYASEQHSELVRTGKLRYLDYDWDLNDTGQQG